MPNSKSSLLKGVLNKRFPHIKFDFKRFIKSDLSPAGSKAKTLAQGPAGVIFELKNLATSDLKILDAAWKIFKHRPSILIVTPEVFQLLNNLRAEIVAHASVIISEMKSLDYVIQLPRFIEAVGRKYRLQNQNERLRRMMEKAFESLAGFDTASDFASDSEREVAAELRDRNLCGLRVSLKGWASVKRRLGAHGQSEVMNSVARLINSAVRNSDRVLHWKESEFLVFLSNAERGHLANCRSRLQESLSSLQLTTNQKALSIPFSVKPIEQMNFLN